LRARGINAAMRNHLYWTTPVSDILRERAAGKVGALILMGHSQGGNDAIQIARARVSKLLQRFAFARLSQSYLWELCSDFSATFTTVPFGHSSLRWLEIST
jgi:hypothetical protein